MSLINNFYDLLNNSNSEDSDSEDSDSEDSDLSESESDFESESVSEDKDINQTKLVLNEEKMGSNLLVNESEHKDINQTKLVLNKKKMDSNLLVNELESVIKIKPLNTVNENKKKINIKSTDEITDIKKKKPQNKNSPKKQTGFKNNTNFKIYNENLNLPIDIDDAISKKQNLTLKQILVLMKLQGIPWMVLNNIHDYLQKKIKRRRINITHASRTFDVSYYNWNNLKQIEIMINSLITPV